MISILNDLNFQEEVINNQLPVLVEFGTNWCGACQILEPVFEQLQQDFNGQIKIAWIDTEVNTKVKEQFRIGEIPSLLFFKNGKLVDQITGLAPKLIITAILRNLLVS